MATEDKRTAFLPLCQQRQRLRHFGSLRNSTLADGEWGCVIARLELHVGGGSFISATWVFHYPYRASSNLQKSSPMQGRNFEFSSKSKGREGLKVNMTMITYQNDSSLKSLNDWKDFYSDWPTDWQTNQPTCQLINFMSSRTTRNKNIDLEWISSVSKHFSIFIESNMIKSLIQ